MMLFMVGCLMLILCLYFLFTNTKICIENSQFELELSWSIDTVLKRFEKLKSLFKKNK